MIDRSIFQNGKSILLSIIFFAMLSRLAFPPALGHLVNFSALNAFALFCGAYCGRRSTAMAIVLLSIWLSDIALTQSLFYPGWYWQYGSYALIALLGSLLTNKVNYWNVPASSLASSVLFFIISNFGVWFSSALYTHTSDGLIACYIAGIPFFQNTLASDLVFSAALFGSYAFLCRSQQALSADSKA